MPNSAACALSVRTCSKPTLPDAPLASTKRRACAVSPWLLAEACFAYQQKQLSPTLTYANKKEPHGIRRIPERQHTQNGKLQESSPSQLKTIPTPTTRTKPHTPSTQQKIPNAIKTARTPELRAPTPAETSQCNLSPGCPSCANNRGDEACGILGATMARRHENARPRCQTEFLPTHTQNVSRTMRTVAHNDKFAAAQTIMLTVRSSLCAGS